MHLTLNISPCPNDTFMFDALINRRIDTRGYTFDVNFFDIEELNHRVMYAAQDITAAPAVPGSAPVPEDAPPSPDVSKISYAVLPGIIDRYTVLDSGSALGHGNGPLLVARQGVDIHTPGLRVAVPGIHTTANMLLQRLFPGLIDRRPVLFSQIAPAVARGEFDAGVLIHEGRFTYRDHGLELVADLGAEWERATSGLPLPLGAIVASRHLPPGAVKTIEELIRESIEYGFSNPEKSRDFVKSHAREMDDDVIRKHIALFVNQNSLSLTPSARLAIGRLTGTAI